MPSTEQKNLLSSLLILFILLLPFLFLYMATFRSGSQPSFSERAEFDYGGRPVQQMQPVTVQNQHVLNKNQRETVGRNALVYRGIEKKTIYVDLYLLDMDPEQPFRKKFDKKSAKKEMRFGEGRYRLISANSNLLVIQEIKK